MGVILNFRTTTLQNFKGYPPFTSAPATNYDPKLPHRVKCIEQYLAQSKRARAAGYFISLAVFSSLQHGCMHGDQFPL